ncbi:MAG: hypothetical protein V7644_2704 [Actinomycetota bacterium]|jgi:hypothetical protein
MSRLDPASTHGRLRARKISAATLVVLAMALSAPLAASAKSHAPSASWTDGHAPRASWADRHVPRASWTDAWRKLRPAG